MNTRACAHHEPTRLVHLAALLAAALCLICAPAQSRTTCRDTVLGTFCTSEVDFAAFAQQAYQTQQASQWCWAASISMLFAYHGHPVSQARIVSEAYGSPINMPAQGYVMAQQLNRRWIDDNGRAFTARVSGLYDA